MTGPSANDVKTLRERTGVGMMDCKRALLEAQGDLEAAIDLLRSRGLAKAAKKSTRAASEGLVAAIQRDGRATLIEVNAETDFVAMNDRFKALVETVLACAHHNPSHASVEEVLQIKHKGSQTIGDLITEAVAEIGENIRLRRLARIQVERGALGLYIHNRTGENLGRLAVVVRLESINDADPALGDLARKIAMHGAAMSPVALDATQVDADTLAREAAVLEEKAKSAGKPDKVIKMIVESGIRSFFKDNTLLEQNFVHEPTKSVAQVIGEAENLVGAPIKASGYLRFALGEGVEKQETDFAAEVASISGSTS